MESAVVVVFVVCSLVLSVFCAPAPGEKDDLLFAKQFMSRFGYLESGDSQSESLIRVEQAIKDVQRFGNLPQTGELDNSTLHLMKSPRCGLPDIVKSKSRRRKRITKRIKRYILGPSLGWKKRRLTYYIANWSPVIGQAAMRSELERAWAAWARYGQLKFQEVSSPQADIVIAFGSGYHGDGYPFDGPGSTLAHAFFPGEEGSLGGDIHFDNDETWKINPGEFEEGVDFFTVAVHEIGHSLGLSHSAVPESVMNPYYKRYDSNSFSLGYDDILGMYELYITRSTEREEDTGDENNSDDDTSRRTTTTTTTTRKPTTTKRPERTTTFQPQVTYVGDDESVDEHKNHDPKHKIPGPVEPLTPRPPVRPTEASETPDACEGHFSAVALLRGELFIFKENYLWRLSSPGRVAPGYPVPFHRMFYKLPESLQRVDAAYERDTDSNIVFFSGDKYWVYNGNDIVEGSPRPLTDYGLPSYVRKVDAVMVWAKNRKTYIFSGSEFWRFNESSKTMDPGYPKNIRLFRGVPSDLDSAMTWSDGITYFFKNNLYWAFNNTWLKTEAFYPQPASNYWLGCR